MTEKAQAVLRKTRQRQALRREKILDDLNRSTLDDVGPIGGASGDRFLKELNEMADLEGNAGRKENPYR